MTGHELRAIRHSRRWRQADLAEHLGTSRRNVENWEQSRRPVPGWVAHALAARLQEGRR